MDWEKGCARRHQKRIRARNARGSGVYNQGHGTRIDERGSDMQGEDTQTRNKASEEDVRPQAGIGMESIRTHTTEIRER